VGVFIGWRATPLAAAITTVALVVAYIHTVGFSQLMLAALMGLLRSRRYRDLAVLFFAVFGAGFSLFNQLVLTRLSRSLRFSNPNAIASIHIDRVLQWTPPGMAARAIALADAGRYTEAIPWLLMPAALVVVLVVLWSSVLERGITSAETASAPSGRRRRRGPTVAPASIGARPAAGVVGPFTAVVPSPRRWRPISGPSLAIALKDVRYLWRDPQLKGAVLSSLLATAFIFLPNLGSGSSSSLRSAFGGPVSVLIAPLPALLVVLVLSINSLGLERQGLQTLFLFPVRPLDIFWGKNLVVGGLALVLQVMLTVIKAAITGGWEYAPRAVCGGIAALLVLLGCGNVTSVITPFRSRSMRMGDTSSFASENGCLRSIVSSTALFCAAVLLSPVAAAIAIPLTMGHSEWFVVTLPAIVVYGLVLHQLTTRLVAPILLRRAPDILAATVREA
jgi:ABC-2 type transport system permease protein